MRNNKLLIFDLDGTLLDTLEDLKNSVNFALRSHNYPERSLEQIRNSVGNGFGKRPARHRTVAVISASRDGQYIADLVRKFGVKSVRGSSSRNAVKVLHDAFKTMKDGNLIAMTPDGPRGPKYHLNKGAIQLASKLGVPIIPIAVNYSSYWQLKSWDAFQIPKPWSKITIELGDEIPIPADLDHEEFEAARVKVENALNAITRDTIPPPPPRIKK